MPLKRIASYLSSNLIAGLKKPPFPAPRQALLPIPLYAAGALAIGFGSGLFTPGLLRWPLAFILPFTLLVFPSLVEEAFFRGILIPIDTGEKKPGKIVLSLLCSTTVFVAWHPLNALTLTPAAAPVFYNPYFLAITALLGIACGVAYIYSRSLWLPVIIHWGTVLVWVVFLGGRNRILDL